MSRLAVLGAALLALAAVVALPDRAARAQSTTPDTTAPTITGFRLVSAAKTYAEGEYITVAAVFSEAVTVTGRPRLTLLIGRYTRAAWYVTGVTGVTANASPFEVAFTYKVQAYLEDIDGVIIYPNAVYLRDAADTIKDASGNDADLFSHRALCCDNMGKPTSGVVVNTRPAPPRRFRAKPGNARVSLSWTSPTDNSETAGASDGTITKWQVRRKTTGAWGTWTDITNSSATTTSYVVTSLVNGTTYAFQVRAHDAGGAGKESAVRRATPVAAASLATAQVRGDVMAIRYDAVLDAASAPAASAFTVTAAGAERGVAGVSVQGRTVKLRLARAVGAADAVTVGYAPPADAVRLRDAGGAEASAFTGVPAENATAPLKARLAGAPSEHGGAGEAFTVRIAFSAPVEVDATKAVREGTVKVKGGRVTRSTRVDLRLDLWELDIEPGSHGAVTLRLPATKDCAAAGAICTADGRRLIAAVKATVGGPPLPSGLALSVADARAREGTDEALAFAVTLSRAAEGPVTVRYATKNGSAKAGEDYRRAKGKLTFAAGETEKTVSVRVLDDAHDEGEETFTLALSKASGAAIAGGEATGTITNADPLQKDWLARFGRAAASDAVAAVTARLQTPRDAGSHLTVRGHRMPLDGSGNAGTGLPPASAGGPGGASQLSWSGDPSGDGSRTMGERELLLGTSFRAVLGSGAGVQWTGWGQGASVSRFSSAGSGLSLSGETATGSMGMDYERGRLLTGFAMTHSLGEGTARGSGRTYAMGSSVTTMLPYARLRLTERVSAWGLAGTGSGSLTLDLDGGAAERYGTDLSMTLAATGVRGELVTPAEAGGFALALKADAFWVRTESDRVSAPGVGNLAGARAEASRLRAVLDGSRTFALAGGGTLTPSVELGVRHDGGDAETGTGMELGAGVGYADPSRGLDMALRVHGVAAHAERGYSDWSVSGSLRFVPGVSGRGLSMSLTPSWGADPGGSERLWMLPDASGLAANDNAAPSSRLDAEMGYGMALFGGGYTGTPNVGFGLSDTAREVRMGWRLSPASGGGFEFNLDASRHDSATDTPEHRIGFGIAARW